MSYTTIEAIAPTEVVEVEVVPEDFDYSQVQQVWRKELIEDTDQLQHKAQQTLLNMIEMGQIAEKWRERLPNGQYGKWVELKFPGSGATSRYCRQVFKRFSSLKECQLLTKFDTSAARLLSAETVPDEAFERAIALAETGTQITEKRAKLLVKGEVAVVQVGKEVTVRNPDCKEHFGRQGTVVQVDKNRILHIEDQEGDVFTILDTELYPSTKHVPTKKAVTEASGLFPPSFSAADETRLEAMEELVKRAIELGEIILAVLPVHPAKNSLREWLNDAKRYF